MKIPNLSGLKGAFNVGKTVLAAHRPEILLATSVVGGIASTVLAGKGGYEAGQKVLKAEFMDLDLDSQEAKVNPLSVKEKAELTWQCYVPAGVALVTSVGSTTGLHLVHVKEKKALVTAGAIALEDAKAKFQKWEQQTLDVMSEEERNDVQERLYEKAANADGIARVVNSDGIVQEKYLVRDGFTGRDRWSSKEEIEDALNETNNWINNEGDVELNHFYGLAGFDHIPQGDDIGWSGQLIELKWDLVTREDGRPVRRFTFREAPEKDYTGKYA